MKTIRSLLAMSLALFALAWIVAPCTAGCALLTPKNAHSVLDATQIACVFGTELVEEKTVADACNIARDLLPILRNLIGQREGAKRSGVRWPGSDAGVRDAAAE